MRDWKPQAKFTNRRIRIMKIDKERVRSILFITLSNLGDIILTIPVLEKLRHGFPEAYIDVITGAPGKDIFVSYPAVREVAVPKKPRSFGKRMLQIIELRRRRYDLVVDLKNSLVPYVIGARFHSRLFVSLMNGRDLPGSGRISPVRHKKEEHLSRLLGLGIDPLFDAGFFIPVTDEEKSRVTEMMDSGEGGKAVILNPGAKSHLKRWDAVKYAGLADRLVSELGCRVFVTGSDEDRETVQWVTSRMKRPVMDLCCRTSIGALLELMSRVDLVITNDSAPLHVASAAGVPTIAVFGPSDERKYGPLAERSIVVKPGVSCRPCGRARCARGRVNGCISGVGIDEVFQAARELLEGENRRQYGRDSH